MIDWKDSDSLITPHFKVKEALWLPRWKRMACEADGLDESIKENLVAMCEIMEIVRTLLQHPINVHSFYRPKAYNLLIGGAKNSAHTEGKAIDFDCLPNMSIEEVKIRLRPNLKRYKIRMEINGPLAGWIHLDTRVVPPGGKREFFP